MTVGPDISGLSHAQKDALIGSLMAQVAALVARVAELEAKLGLPSKTPDNSSLPPSKGQKPSAPAAPKAKANPHAGAHRPLHPDPTSKREFRALRCQGCGTDVSGVAQSPCESYDRVEIPEIAPDVTRVTLHGGVCPCCAKRFKAEPPQGLGPGSPFGPNLRALVIYLRSVQGIPLARLSDVLKDLFGLDISEGALVNILGDSREPFAVQTSLIKARLLAGTALASDETGLRVGKANWWLWVFHHGDSAVFVADAHRSKAVVEAFLGEWRPDYWISDRLASQIGWAKREHQVCLAHLIRDVQYAIDAGDAVFAPGMKGLLKRACAVGRRRDALAESTLKTYQADPEPEARSPHAVEPDRQSRTPDPNHHQEGPPTSLRLRDKPRPRSDQQRLRAGAAPQRGLPQDHQWLSKRVGSQALRRHSLRRRNRTTTLNPRHRRHPPNPPSKTNPSPRLNQPTARVSNYPQGVGVALSARQRDKLESGFEH